MRDAGLKRHRQYSATKDALRPGHSSQLISNSNLTAPLNASRDARSWLVDFCIWRALLTLTRASCCGALGVTVGITRIRAESHALAVTG